MKRAVCGCALLFTLVAAPPAFADEATPLPADLKGCLPPPQTIQGPVPWAQKQLVPQQVWPVTKGAGVVVGVVDTGVDAKTPQLAGRVRPGTDVAGKGKPADTDCNGHGTFVAGIIAAAPGDTGFAGVAPDVTVLPVRCATIGPDGKPALTAATIADGLRAAVDGGAKVVNISASVSTPDDKLAQAVQHAVQQDVVVVASAANSAQQGDPVTYPAAYPGVIAVGAIDANGGRADFSQTGAFLSLVAPGVDVASTGPGGAGHWRGSGTSYSAPFVTGVAALVRAYRPELTAAQVKHRLEATAVRPATTELPDPGMGWGTVDPVAAVTAMLPEENAPVVTPPPAPAPAPDRGDEAGPLFALTAAVLVVVFAAGLAAVSRLVRSGRARNWAPPER
ncbi:type VII secretion-associated serine protease mycosin [Lentzea sp. NBRC 102530]|uniref:type VII secretion-associated serine protease mycosin n=1 Tax=Lentzea sp. NBRC 102530 TaxID=3032201 RepID=UPI0024A44A59|nr:type VII secretion-associated serine protease mycosin [Lentzea sp. NBRC 102530]GLY46809.1 type VII secretion-associated serine protease [Lentzea sp. NBRC 102530]